MEMSRYQKKSGIYDWTVFMNVSMTASASDQMPKNVVVSASDTAAVQAMDTSIHLSDNNQ